MRERNICWNSQAYRKLKVRIEKVGTFRIPRFGRRNIGKNIGPLGFGEPYPHNFLFQFSVPVRFPGVQYPVVRSPSLDDGLALFLHVLHWSFFAERPEHRLLPMVQEEVNLSPPTELTLNLLLFIIHKISLALFSWEVSSCARTIFQSLQVSTCRCRWS